MKHFHIVNFGPRDLSKAGIPNEIYATFATPEPAATLAQSIASNSHLTTQPCNLAVIECDCPQCAKASAFCDFGSLQIQ